MNPELGYNDTNTNAPHTNVNDSRILLSGGASRVMRRGGAKGNYTQPDMEMYVSKLPRDRNQVYPGGTPDWRNVGKKPIKNSMLFKGGNVIEDMMLEVAKKQLKDYMDGVRKTKPAKKYLEILESSGIISKIKSDMSGGVNRLKKANRWRDFSNETARMGIDTAKYGYEQYQEAMNPVNKAISSTKKLFGGKTNERRVEEADQWTDYAVRTGDKGIGLARRGYENFQEAVNPVGAAAKSEGKKTAKGIGKAVNKLFGFGLEQDIKKQVSPWVAFVKAYAMKHNIPYKEAMKEAAPAYKQLKGNGYNRIG
jgi:hypothetical protein